MLKVVLTDKSSLCGTDYNIEEKIFRENGIDFFIEDCKTDKEVIEKCKDADGVVTIYTKLHEDIISKLNNCKVIVRYGIGYDNIDVKAASKKGINVCNIPDYCISEVATHTMALILALERKIAMFDRSVRRGEWNSNYGYPIHRLSSLRLGLVGFGNIARQTAVYAKPFGFDIIAYDPFLPDDIFNEMKVKRVDLDTLFQKSDIISLHVPLNEQTKHLINKENILKMKDTVVIINTSRGPIIKLYDLIDALKNKRILAAGLDVLESEPLLNPNAEILKFENVIVTPHTSFNTIESSEDQHRKVAETVCKVLKGEFPKNIINRKSI